LLDRAQLCDSRNHASLFHDYYLFV
jgi:hypothetical protein